MDVHSVIGEMDLVTMGRTLVDMYGHQVGCGLEETESFSKYIGGCPANVAVGAARLGLRVGHVTRVGDDHHGRFLRNQLEREGVDVTHVHSDPGRPTAVAFLGIRDKETFPLLHYRDNCADMGISPSDYDPEYLGAASALLVTGSHVTTPHSAANLDHAIDTARRLGTRVVFDVDFRPLFWKLVPRDAGESRFVGSEVATRATQRVLGRCDLVVGTEEEIRIAGGELDTVKALIKIRALTAAAIVVKRGPLGCVVFPDRIPGHLDDGIVGEGFPVEIFNVVGAGDGFLAGFLSSWIRGATWQECCRRGNACGALVVSRHGCAPASPTRAELDWYLRHASGERRLFDNKDLERLHRATTRRQRAVRPFLLACDSIAEPGASPHPGRARSGWIRLVAQIVLRLRKAGLSVGLVVDEPDGHGALFELGTALDWTVRSMGASGVAPFEFTGGKSAATVLRSWPQSHIVKCAFSPVTGEARAVQRERLRELQSAAELWGQEFMLSPEIEYSRSADSIALLTAQVEGVYESGVYPDWWGIPCPSGSGLATLAEVIRRSDENCRGIIAFEPCAGPAGSEIDPAYVLRGGADGVAVGNLILGEPVRDWSAGRLDDQQFCRAVEMRIEGLAAHLRREN